MSNALQASLEPRGPYSEGELEKLYPKGLELKHVQIVCSVLSSRYSTQHLDNIRLY